MPIAATPPSSGPRRTEKRNINLPRVDIMKDGLPAVVSCVFFFFFAVSRRFTIFFVVDIGYREFSTRPHFDGFDGEHCILKVS